MLLSSRSVELPHPRVKGKFVGITGPPDGMSWRVESIMSQTGCWLTESRIGRRPVERWKPTRGYICKWPILCMCINTPRAIVMKDEKSITMYPVRAK